MIIAVDTGGTKTLVARFSRSGRLEASQKFPTPQDFEQYLTQTIATIRELQDDQPIEALTVAIPGDVDHGVIRVCPNLRDWKNVFLQKRLTEQFPDTPIVVENDARIAAIGESRQLRSVPSLAIYITFSTGIGTGMAAYGKPIKEFHLFEAGKMLFEHNGSLQHWETFASGRAIKQTYGTYASEITDDATWREIAHNMSLGIMNILVTFQPEYIIIGGSIGTYFDRYAKHLTAILEQTIPDYMAWTKIIQATYPEEAVIYGCYQYAHDQLAR